MIEIVKSLTQEQKEAIAKFVADWIEDDNLIKPNSDYTAISIEDGDVDYYASLNIFDRTKLSTIIVSNNRLNLRICIRVSDILDMKSLKIIEDYIVSLQISNGVGSELTDSEFYKITNLDIDPSTLRARKIKKIKENM